MATVSDISLGDRTAGYRTTSQYDVVGRRVAVMDARGFRATSVFDAIGQVTASIDPLGRIATQTFDAAQRPVSSQDGNGHVTTLLYDLDSRRVATLDALGYLTTNVYDPASQEIAMLDPRGNRWSTTYDAASRPIAKIDPLNRRETSGYDAANRRTLRVDARGFATTYSHDAVGQTLGWIYPNAQRATLSYDPNGNRTAMADWTGEYSYEYTALNQLAAESNALGKRLSYGYDSVQSLSLLMNADGGSTTYQYDALNRVTVTQDAAGGRTTTSYDATNNRTLKILPNGTRSSSVFDGASQLVDLSHLKSDDSVIGRYQYGYDNASNVTLTTEANGDTIGWSYDALNRLTGDVRTGSDAYNKQFTYDPVGNRLVENSSGALTTSTFDVANQLSNSISGSGTTLFTFDLSGNQQIVQTPGGALTTNTWDYENQNTLVLLPSGDSVDMAFNAANRRVAKVSAVTDKVFLWSSVTDNIIQDLSPSGSGLVANSFLPGTYGELIKQDDGQSSFFLFDRRGSTMGIANSAQVIADTFRFDGYGNLVARTGSSLTPFQFQGAWGYFLDAELGSVYIRRRSYLPLIGRWMSVDPLGFIDGNNLYGTYYVPSESDPSGLGPCGPLPLLQVLFETWYRREKKRLNDNIWYADLPKCPCHIEIVEEVFIDRKRRLVFDDPCPEDRITLRILRVEEIRELVTRHAPVNPDNTKWKLLNEDDVKLANAVTGMIGHPGGCYELRSIAAFGQPGTQCVYNCDGLLLLKTPGAGSYDLVSPSSNVPGHNLADVQAFQWALCLDGDGGMPNPDGDYFKKYTEVRPVPASEPSPCPHGEI